MAADAILTHQAHVRWIGCEYVPAKGTEAGLGWGKPYL